jgi:hypothetical protein
MELFASEVLPRCSAVETPQDPLFLPLEELAPDQATA